MNKIIINESSLKKLVKLITEEDEYDDYEDDTSYGSYEYKDVIENYLNRVASSFNDVSCYVEEENDTFYLDFLDFKVFFDLDMNSGILYITHMNMYERTNPNDAFKMDDVIIKVLTLIKKNPLNVSQTLQN